jgi:uncharacterized protein (DUF58 family)
VIPSRRVFLALVAGAFVVAIDPAAGFAVDALVVVLLIVDAIRARRPAWPGVTVDAPVRMAQGQTAAARLALANPTSRAWTVRLELDVPETLAETGADEPRDAVLVAQGETVLPIALRAHARGRHAITAVHLRRLGPLGLAWAQRTIALDRVVEVVPGLREIRSYRLLATRRQLRRVGFRAVRERGDGTAFESLREYVRGDNPRQLDWKASARHRKLIVRQYEAERSQAVMLCVDTGRLMTEQVGDGDRLDHALAAIGVLAEVARTWDDQVGVLAFSDRIEALLPPGRHAPGQLPSLLAGLVARPVEPDYPRALTHLARVLGQRALIVFFGDAIDREVSAPLATHLALLGRRHLPLFLAIRNPQLFAAAHAPAPDTAAVFHRAAAAELVLARARTLAAMRAAGVLVADVAPDGAVAAAVNRYIEIKRRGAL